MSEFQSGALIDIRPEYERKRDYKIGEVVASIEPVNWVEKNPDQWRRFPIFNQDGSGSCVAQTEAKELGVMRYLKDGNYVHFSAGDIYQQRANKPSAGMGAVDARKIVTSGGATLETLSPSQNMNDSQMDGLVVEPYKREVGKVFKAENYLEIPFADIETVASVIQKTGKAVMVWFYFEIREWTEHPVIINPDLDLYSANTPKHSVAAVDFGLVDGKKCLRIDDSWGTSYGEAGQRTIDGGFYSARNWHSSYLTNFKFDTQGMIKPQYIFNNDLEFGMGGVEVKILQDCLKYEGTFPSDRDSTGYFGSVTLSAVQKFQVKYGIASSGGAGYGRVGPKTRAKLNAIFG